MHPPAPGLAMPDLDSPGSCPSCFLVRGLCRTSDGLRIQEVPSAHWHPRSQAWGVLKEASFLPPVDAPPTCSPSLLLPALGAESVRGPLGERLPLLSSLRMFHLQYLFCCPKRKTPTGEPWGKSPLSFSSEVFLGGVLPSGASQIKNVSHSESGVRIGRRAWDLIIMPIHPAEKPSQLAGISALI